MRIKELREAAGLTQRELAKRLGVSGPAVAQWETGENRPSTANLARLADVFDCSTDYILGRETRNVRV
ncbi:helix-turn-helix domain-containing protein [Oscillibacter valericigenes]|nr:helix-turn-helix domain-containing protein [Oscillibacter valericigenes]